MKSDTKKLIRLLYGIALSVAIVVTGLLLMGACLQIYLSGGEQVYTPEKVAIAFGRIDVAVYICLGLILAGFVLHLALWQTPGKDPKIKHPAMQLRRLRLTRDPQQSDPEKQTALRQLRKAHWGLLIGCIVLCAGFLGVFVFFALVHSTFYPDPADATKYVTSLMCVFGPCATLLLGCGILTASLLRRIAEKQIALYKQCPPLPQPKVHDRPVWIRIVRYAVLVLAVAAMVYGLATGGWQDVLTKAVNICTECVGLG